jgi:hypothetical protein
VVQTGGDAVRVIEHQRPWRCLAGRDLNAGGVDPVRLELTEVCLAVLVVAQPAHQGDAMSHRGQGHRNARGAAAEASFRLDRTEEFGGPAT